jgi:cytochrome c oxidase cbb3-type subunit 3
MDARNRNRILMSRAGAVLALLAMAGSGSRLVAQSGETQAKAAGAPDSLPPTVTAAMVAAGKKVFLGEGLCLACHGPDGKGALGPDLTDAAWLHGSGTYAEIVNRIRNGVPPDSSRTGQIMPPNGGGTLDDGKVRAVAAYVWTLSRTKAKP